MVRVRLSGLPAAALHRMCRELLGTQLLPFVKAPLSNQHAIKYVRAC